MNRIILCVLCVSVVSTYAQEKPNFVFFLVDDLGVMDIGVYGSSFYDTPNVDRLAEDVKRWQYRQERSYSSSLEVLRNRVDEIGSELEKMVSRATNHDGAKNYVSQSVEADDMPVVEHLKFRVSHLERWVSQLDERFKLW